jgi:dipeptidyl aminopeptidase/acylaminoacyl peptidase
VPELTPEMIADMCWPEDLQVSPDGRTAVYRLRPSGKKDEHPVSALWISSADDAPAGPAHAARQFTAGAAEDRAPRWSPDGGQIAFLSDRTKRGTAQLYLIPADGGEARPLTSVEHKKGVEEFLWSSGGGHIAFTSADEPTPDEERREKERDDADVYGEHLPYARLRLLDARTGEVTTLAGGERHITGLAWSPDGAELAYIARRSPALEALGWEHRIERVSVAGGEPRLVARIPHPLDSLVWTADGRALLFIAPVSGRAQSSRAVYRVALENRDGENAGEIRHLALGEESCAMGLEQPPGAKWAILAEARGLAIHLHWLDPRTGACEPLLAPEALPAGSEIESWSVRALSEGGVAVAVVCSSGQQPDEVRMGRSEHPGQLGALARVSAHQSALAGLEFGPQELFAWEAPDGLTLDGILIRPPASAGVPQDKPLPMVVLEHGGPYSRIGQGFHLSWGGWGQWLALAGYAVLMPNYRGGAGHGEQFAAAACGAVGTGDFADVMAGVDTAIARGIADPERLGIGGWSQGGFMSAWAVTQTDRFKAAVDGAGPTDWGMMVMTSDLPDFERELGGSAPWEGVGPHRHAQLSPISFAAAVKTPTLILHGEKDERVPVSQAIGFHRALRERDVPTQLVVYPREPHGIREYAHQVDLLRRVRSWYDRWLRA